MTMTRPTLRSRPLLSRYEIEIPPEKGANRFHYDETKMILMSGEVAAAECGEQLLAGTTKVTFIGHETRDDN